MSTLPAGRPNFLADRINAVQNRANQPMVCECGSSHFFLVRAEQFVDQQYGQTQVRSISINTEPAYICVCGKPVQLKDNSSGKNPEGGRAQYLKSLSLAIEFQKRNDMSQLAKGFVSIEEHKEALATITDLSEKIEWLMNAVTVLEAAAVVQDETEDMPDAEELFPASTPEPVDPALTVNVHSQAKPKGKGKGV